MIAAQDVLLLIARVLMATMFFTSARDKFRRDATEVQQVASLHLPVPALFLVLTGFFEGAGGVALVFGIYTRFAAGAPALFTLFVSLALREVLVVQGATGNSRDDEKHLRRQRRDNRRTHLPLCTRSRRACGDGSLAPPGMGDRPMKESENQSI